jgi:SAM-dependent methyltransferase
MSFYEYQKSLTDKKKKELGIVYTPESEVSYINERCLNLWKKDTPPRVIDFSCGTGIFLHDMAKRIGIRYNLPYSEVVNKYIYGSDIDSNALQICKDLTRCPNLENRDGLEANLEPYDIIVGNPPYVRLQNLDLLTREKLVHFEWCHGDTDLYIAFLQRIMMSDKIYGFICPNSWLHTAAGKEVREEFLTSRRPTELIDFRAHQVFKGVGAYCSIVIANNVASDSYVFKTNLNSAAANNRYDNVNEENFYLNSQEAEFLSRVADKKLAFADCFDVKVGLATLADKVYFLPDCQTKDDLIYCPKKDLYVEKDITKLCFKASKLSYYDTNRQDYIIFPYDSEGNCYKDHFVKNTYPLAYEYLTQNKDKLLARDKGKFALRCEAGKSVWFEYGRTQALKQGGEKILLSTLDKKMKFKRIQQGYFISGYCVFPKEGYNLDDIENCLSHPDATKFLNLKGKPMSGGYYSVSKQFFNTFRFNKGELSVS